MITWKEAQDSIKKIQELCDDSEVEFEEDMADGYLTVKIPCSYAVIANGPNQGDLRYYYGHEED